MSRRSDMSHRKISRATHLELLETRRLLWAGVHGHAKHHDEIDSAIAQIVATLTGVRADANATITVGIAADNLGDNGLLTPVATDPAATDPTTTDAPQVPATDPTAP